MKKVIVLSGVSGVGKTHARLNDPELKSLPFVDIADVYRKFPEFDWTEAFLALAKQVRGLLKKHDVVVVEGYFLPGSRTLAWLLGELKVAGAQADVRYFWEPFETCQERVVGQYERGEIPAAECRRRIELLKQCWTPLES